MKIQEVTIRELRDLAQGRKSWPWPASSAQPITRQRALAHSENPRASDADVALLVGYQDDEVVSYLGILPDRILLNGTEQSFGWLTTWWTKPGQESGGALFLLLRSLKLYSNRIGVSEYTDSAAKIYKALKKFRVITPRTVLLAHIKPDFARIFSARLPALQGVEFPFHLLTSVVDGAAYARTAIWRNRQKAEIVALNIEYLQRFDEQSRQFLATIDRSAEIFRRDPDDLDWLLLSPWVVTSPLSGKQAEKYAFSAVSRRFEKIMFRMLRPDGSIGALVILSIRDDLLKVPYAFVAPDYYPQVALAILLHIDALGARGLFVLHEQLKTAILAASYPSFSVKFIQRDSLFTLSQVALPDPIFMQDGDGDCAFT